MGHVPGHGPIWRPDVGPLPALGPIGGQWDSMTTLSPGRRVPPWTTRADTPPRLAIASWAPGPIVRSMFSHGWQRAVTATSTRPRRSVLPTVELRVRPRT